MTLLFIIILPNLIAINQYLVYNEVVKSYNLKKKHYIKSFLLFISYSPNIFKKIYLIKFSNIQCLRR